MRLPKNSINSWGDLYTKFIDNFQGTFTKPGVEWDLYQIHQKKGESLREFIQRYMKKKNTIPGVSDAVVMARGQGSRPAQEVVTKTTRNGQRTLRYGQPVRKSRRDDGHRE